MLYRHFSDKQTLFAEVHALRMRDFQDVLQRAANAESDPIARLEARGRRYVEYAVENPISYRAVFMALDDIGTEVFAGSGAGADSGYSDLVDDVRECISAGLFEAHDAELIARLIWSSVHGLSSMIIAMPAVVEPYEIDELIDAMVTAVSRSFIAPSRTSAT